MNYCFYLATRFPSLLSFAFFSSALSGGELCYDKLNIPQVCHNKVKPNTMHSKREFKKRSDAGINRDNRENRERDRDGREEESVWYEDSSSSLKKDLVHKDFKKKF